MQAKKEGEKKTFFKGAAWIATGGFLSKLIGALYRIPLTNLIGGYGMGLYQLAYPLYTLLLTISATGIPSAIAKLTAERVGAGTPLRPLFNTALRLFAWIGLGGTLLMAGLAIPLSYAQGAPEAAGGYWALAPSVLLVSALSVYRGYMQGKKDMFPTAVSEVVEQIVKVAVGLPIAYYLRATPARAVVGLLFAVSVAEGAALLFVWLYARKKHPRLPLKGEERVRGRSVLKTSLPVTVSAALLPLSHLVDSVLIVRLLQRHTESAVNLYGLMTGGALTLINLPVSVCYGLAAASVPAVASAQSNKERRKNVRFSLLSTLALSLPCAVGLFLLAGLAQRLVYPSLSVADGEILVRLVRMLAVSTVTLSCLQTAAACLTALGKPSRAAFSMGVAMSLKAVLQLWLVGNPRFSIYGAALATNFGYLVAFLLDLYYNIKVTKEDVSADGVLPIRRSKNDRCRWFGCKKRGLDRGG